MSEKIDVLNCLVFDTPKNFWVTQSTKTKTGNDLAGASDKRYDFLGYGDWGCSRAPDVPFLSSCLKHDVAYASLKKFVPGISLPAMINFDRDSTWNPRNKFLADLTLAMDMEKDADNWEAPPASCEYLIPDGSMSFALSADSASIAYGICKMYNTQSGVHVRAEVMSFVLESLYPPLIFSPTIIDIVNAIKNQQYIVDNTQ